MKQRDLILAAIAIVSLYGARDILKVYYLMNTDNWTKYDHWFEFYGGRHGVPPEWLKAIALNESSLGTDPSVARGMIAPWDTEGSKSMDGKSWGLMQVTLKTARSELDSAATPEKLNDPEYSFKLAAQYLAKLSRMYPKVDTRYTEYVIKAYNQGPGNMNDEIKGRHAGYANEYWARFQRNLTRVTKE